MTEAEFEKLEYQNKIIYLRAENERLRAALEIYANRANWSVVTCGRNEPYKIATWRVDETGYTIAKDALKGGKA